MADSEKGKRSQRSLTSAGVALALICACWSGHARLPPLGGPFGCVEGRVSRLFVVGFLLDPTLVALPLNEPPVAAALAAPAAPVATHHFQLSFPTSPTLALLFPHFPASPRAFHFPIHAVTRSSVFRRQDLTFHSVPVLAEVQRPQSPAVQSAFTFQPPFCHQTSQPSTSHLPTRSCRSESRHQLQHCTPLATLAYCFSGISIIGTIY